MTAVAEPAAPSVALAFREPSSLRDHLGTVDHKIVGTRYMVTAFVFFLVGGVEAATLRLQLSGPNRSVLGPEAYDQVFTMHGVTMIFLFITPMFSGFGNYLVPLMIGARDMAFPRLNAFGYWVYLFSGLFLYGGIFTRSLPDGGWFNYVPLSGAEYSPGSNIDFYALGLLLLGISTTVGGLNFIVTIVKLRAPGMTISRMPLFVWGILFTSFVMVFAIPALSAANLLLTVDRQLGGKAFDPAGGGQPVLWQHLFWIFGHPDVYLIFLPAVAMVSTVIPVFCRQGIVGYTWMVLSSGAIAVISFGVWVHHMFATGLPPASESFFSAASTVIAIPSGVQMFAWLATIWEGRPRWRSPMLFVAGFLVTFTIGGLSGVMFAIVPFDQQVTDSYFVVAHFHYVLVGGAVFPLFAGLHHWFPKFTGRMLSERLGVVTFVLIFVGFNVGFFPMHLLGLAGMPRRIQTYDGSSGFETNNLISSIGVAVLTVGVAVFVVNVVWSRRRGALAGDDPWEADTLEWATSSPPPPENFVRIPVVHGRHPLWDTGDDALDAVDLPGRTTLATNGLTSRPEHVVRIIGDSVAPLAVAAALAFVAVGILVSAPWLTVLAGVGVLAALAWWHMTVDTDDEPEVAS